MAKGTEFVFGDERVPARIWAKIVQGASGCWTWTGATNGNAYGVAAWDTPRGIEYTHRIVYEALSGPIPDEHDLDHLCFDLTGESNTLCCHPAHLEPVLPEENRRRAAARRTHCPNGHPYTPENLYLWREKRMCRACRVRAQRATNLRKHPDRRGFPTGPDGGPLRDEHGKMRFCINGHEFTPENTLVSGGQRYCRICLQRRRQAARRNPPPAVESPSHD